MGLFLNLAGTTRQAFGIKDTNSSHYLNLTPGSDLTTNRALNLVTGDVDRTITLSGNPTLADWFDQSVKVAASPTFAGLKLTTGAGLGMFLTSAADGTASWGDVSISSRKITQVTHGFAVQDVLYHNGTIYVKAKADASTTAEVIGIVSATNGADNFTISMGGYVSGLSGLTAGTVYFLSPTTAGALTSTEPSAVGHVSKPILIAVSTTAGHFFNMRGVISDTGLSPFDQFLNMADSPTFAGLTVVGAAYVGSFIATGNPGFFAVQSADVNPAVNSDLGFIDAWKKRSDAGSDVSARILFSADATTSNGDAPGRISFWTTPDGSATLAERMRITSAGLVGIGGTPDAILHVQKDTDNLLKLERITTSNGYAAIQIKNISSVGGAYLCGFGSKAAEALADSYSYLTGDGSNVHLTITYGGKVGIGTTVPGYLLEIYKDSNAIVDFLLLKNPSNTSSGGRILFNNGFGNLAAIKAYQIDNGALANDGKLTFQTAANSALADRMTIDQLGNIGIGTVNPNEALHLESGAIALGSAGTYHYCIKHFSGQVVLGIGYWNQGSGVWYPSGNATVAAINLHYTGKIGLSTAPDPVSTVRLNLAVYANDAAAGAAGLTAGALYLIDSNGAYYYVMYKR